ncbi:VOC family protein [Adhaeribacter radiodurans]|uniref:Glyoxalase n=1 Tax=Adhaeribacter radiodurans TaxID=2745197 RepID=A0A7L7LAA6_9BACT|nr:VOC family protein [Adhaeribacter radiodurans]QMU29485.1 glyoxalase [Adhaeribacter radiodurans]
MNYISKSIRTFIGTKNYKESREFYKDLGFKEVEIGDKMCLFKVNENVGFYLQDYYVEDWVNNSMIFLEVNDIDKCAEDLLGKKLNNKYKEVKFTGIKDFDWGRELYMNDPSGVLWHFGEFNK